MCWNEWTQCLAQACRQLRRPQGHRAGPTPPHSLASQACSVLCIYRLLSSSFRQVKVLWIPWPLKVPFDHGPRDYRGPGILSHVHSQGTKLWSWLWKAQIICQLYLWPADGRGEQCSQLWDWYIKLPFPFWFRDFPLFWGIWLTILLKNLLVA